MMTLFNREQVLEAYVLERTREAAEKAAEKAKQDQEIDMAKKMHDLGMDITVIAKVVNRSVEIVQGWLGVKPVKL